MNKAFKPKTGVLEAAILNKTIRVLGSMCSDLKRETRLIEKKTLESKLRLLK